MELRRKKFTSWKSILSVHRRKSPDQISNNYLRRFGLSWGKHHFYSAIAPGGYAARYVLILYNTCIIYIRQYGLACPPLRGHKTPTRTGRFRSGR